MMYENDLTELATFPQRFLSIASSPELIYGWILNITSKSDSSCSLSTKSINIELLLNSTTRSSGSAAIYVILVGCLNFNCMSISCYVSLVKL